MIRTTLFIILVLSAIGAIAYFALSGRPAESDERARKIEEAKARILADANWKKAVEEKAKAKKRTFEQQLILDATFTVDNY